MKSKIKSIVAVAAVMLIYLFDSVLPAHAAVTPIEIRSKGNIYGTSHGAAAPDNIFEIKDLYNLQADFLTCQETADATRTPMIYALTLKGVTVPANASYSDIAAGILRIPDEYIWVDEIEGVTYDYHNHIDEAGERTNDTANCAIYDVQGGCYTEPVYHTHTGSAAAGGGCYTNPIYHTHAGSAVAGGGCYTSPIYHTHTGSAAAGGGCYTNPIYHTHTGNAVAGGGCYTNPVYHTHTDVCYMEKTVGCSCSGYSQGELLGYHQYDGYPIYACLNCGHQSTDHSDGKCTISTMTQVLICGKDNSTVESYALSCGKNNSTVESYALSCGKNNSTIESYVLSCGKNNNTVESYTLSCGKEVSSIEGYTLGCNHLENQIVAAHISY